MGSSPTRLRVIHEHGSGKAVWTCPFWPSVPELRVLIPLEPEMMERLLSSRPRSSTSPSAMTHHDLDLSIRFPFIISFVPRFISITCTNTLNPRPWERGLGPLSSPHSLDRFRSSPGRSISKTFPYLSTLLPTQPLSLSACYCFPIMD